ncbi:MFS transporter [Tsukamurella soli]|uniref:MFS transporter n=2 Tax=Tsukamurella soli TaxID=644556 RepID=A0ABP8J642_9ACTN
MLAVVCIGTMMTFVDVSSTIAALATIQADLRPSAASAVWITSAYSLVVASLVLVAGTAADLLGRRLVFGAGAATFAIGSAFAMVAGSTGMLIAAQAVMGVGGAMVLPSGLALVTHAFSDPHRRTVGVSIWAGSSGLGLALGPVLAGTFVKAGSWHLAFATNVVLGIGAVLGAVLVLAESRYPGRRRLDPVGVALGTLTVATLTFAVIEGGTMGYGSETIVTAWIVAVAALAGFVTWESRHPSPMLDVRLFQSPSFSAVMAVAATAMFGFTGTALLTTLQLQHSAGTTVLGAGLRLLAMFIPFVAASASAGLVVRRTGFRVILTAGLTLMAAGDLLLLLTRPGPDFARMLPGLLVVGLGAGVLVAPSTAAAVISVPTAQAGMASAAVNMFRQVGNVLGAAVLGTVLTTGFAEQLGRRLSTAHVPTPVADGVVAAAGHGDAGAAALPAHLTRVVEDAVRGAFTTADHHGLVVGAAVLLVVAVPAALFVRSRPAAA